MLDPMVRAKILLGRHFHDPFDAFTEFTPGSEHAMLSLGDFISGFQTLGTGDELNDIELEAVFQRCGPDDDTGMLSLRQFMSTFADPKKQGISGGEMSIRSFEEVMMECKDERGVQKFIAIPAGITFSDLLQRLKGKFGRPVMFQYEADGHTYSVKSERDLKLCWDSVEEAHKGSGVAEACSLCTGNSDLGHSPARRLAAPFAHPPPAAAAAAQACACSERGRAPHSRPLRPQATARRRCGRRSAAGG